MEQFGLEVWTSNAIVANAEDARYGNPLETAVSYLILPNDKKREGSWYPEMPQPGPTTQSQSGSGIPVTGINVPTQRSLRRFCPALQILDLNAHVSRRQQGQSMGLLNPGDDATEAKAAKRAVYAANSWPQLTLLAWNTVDPEELQDLDEDTEAASGAGA